MRRLIVVSEHPSLHRGFATVARRVARRLHASQRWRVAFAGRYPPAGIADPEPYTCLDVDPEGAPDAGSEERLRDLLHGLIAADGTPARIPLLSIGSARDHECVLDRLDEARVRTRVTFVGYMPVDYAPLPPSLVPLLQRIDVIVPFSAFGQNALDALRLDSGSPVVATPIPHGVDLSTFRPADIGVRHETRRRLWNVEDDAVVIGFFGRNCRHKHPELALRIFATFARGEYVVCGPPSPERAGYGAAGPGSPTGEGSGQAAQHVTLCQRDPVDDTTTAPTQCGQCASTRVRRGEEQPEARLYLHTELLDRADRLAAGGWDLEMLAERYGVAGQVHFDRSLRIGFGISDAELAGRMGACDIHLLPYDSGGWELTVLETAACGVPNVITDVAAPPDYAAPFAELIPASVRVQSPIGMKGYIDERLALEALLRLTRDRDHRAMLGRRGVEAAAGYSWERVGDLWERLLVEIARP